jgi:hypothetical protein
VKAERHQWAAAMKRAAGEKVLDDPKLLKRSLKREAKRKEKSAATWAQKEKEQKEARDAKQNKRQTNLKVPCLACPPPHVSVVSATKLVCLCGLGLWDTLHALASPPPWSPPWGERHAEVAALPGRCHRRARTWSSHNGTRSATRSCCGRGLRVAPTALSTRQSKKAVGDILCVH